MPLCHMQLCGLSVLGASLRETLAHQGVPLKKASPKLTMSHDVLTWFEPSHMSARHNGPAHKAFRAAITNSAQAPDGGPGRVRYGEPSVQVVHAASRAVGTGTPLLDSA